MIKINFSLLILFILQETTNQPAKGKSISKLKQMQRNKGLRIHVASNKKKPPIKKAKSVPNAPINTSLDSPPEAAPSTDKELA